MALSILLLPGKPLTVDSLTNLETTRALAQGKLSVPRSLVTRQGHDGNHYSLYGPLLPMIALPGYLLGEAIGNRSSPGASSFMLGDQLALATNTWISAIIVWLLYRIGLFAGASAWRVVYLAGLCGLSTMLLPYSRDFFNQPLAAACLLIAHILLIIQNNHLEQSSGTDGKFLWLGCASLAMGAAILSRMDMCALVPGFYMSAYLMQPRQLFGMTYRSIRWLAALLMPLSACLMGLLLLDRYRWGGWLATPYASLSFNTPLIDTLPRFFFSPDLSLIFHNPLLLVSWGMIPFSWRQYRWLYIGIFISSITYLILVGSYVDYHGGICPGPRYLMVLVPLHLVPLFLGWKNLERKWIAVIAIGLVALPGILMNGYSAFVDYTQMPTAWDFWSGILTG